MALLYVTEFVSQGMDLNARAMPIAQLPVSRDQTPVSVSGSSQTSSSFLNNTGLVRLHTDAICSVAFGTSPTATTTNMRMAANQTEYFAVPQNGAYKVAVIPNT